MTTTNIAEGMLFVEEPRSDSSTALPRMANFSGTFEWGGHKVEVLNRRHKTSP